MGINQPVSVAGSVEPDLTVKNPEKYIGKSFYTTYMIRQKNISRQ